MRADRPAALILAVLLALQPLASPVLGQQFAVDTRVYLTDGSVVMGQLLENSDLIIVRSEGGEIFTFEPEQIDKIVTLDGLGSEARTEVVREFPYISFLGGTVALGLLSWLQFDTASDRDAQADLNEDLVPARARDLRDKADRARLYGWGAGLLALGSMGVALIPRQAERRVFPEFSVRGGQPALQLVVRQQF